MKTATLTPSTNVSTELEFATFYVGELLIGVNIQQVQEINRHVDVTSVPHSPECVCGVVNLRGEVVTVVDLRTILGLEETKLTEHTRNVVVKSRDEQIGLLVDRIADVVMTKGDKIGRPPANIGGVDGRFFKGVLQLESELMVVLDVEAALSSTGGE